MGCPNPAQLLLETADVECRRFSNETSTECIVSSKRYKAASTSPFVPQTSIFDLDFLLAAKMKFTAFSSIIVLTLVGAVTAAHIAPREASCTDSNCRCPSGQSAGYTFCGNPNIDINCWTGHIYTCNTLGTTCGDFDGSCN
ncbi:hypothetical protein F5887DRAFT_1284161 [Amanita rubescens]|nr:hypothetical protein F5887DRAFT_1284161 [Amanita rubescens]